MKHQSFLVTYYETQLAINPGNGEVENYREELHKD